MLSPESALGQVEADTATPEAANQRGVMVRPMTGKTNDRSQFPKKIRGRSMRLGQSPRPAAAAAAAVSCIVSAVLTMRY
jgi:hypothetical protein